MATSPIASVVFFFAFTLHGTSACSCFGPPATFCSSEFGVKGTLVKIEGNLTLYEDLVYSVRVLEVYYDSSEAIQVRTTIDITTPGHSCGIHFLSEGMTYLISGVTNSGSYTIWHCLSVVVPYSALSNVGIPCSESSTTTPPHVTTIPSSPTTTTPHVTTIPSSPTTTPEPTTTTTTPTTIPSSPTTTTAKNTMAPTSKSTSTESSSSSIAIVVGSTVGAIFVIIIVIILIIIISIFYKRRSNESATTKTKGKESDSSPQYENPVFDQSKADVHTYQDLKKPDAQSYENLADPHTYQDLKKPDQEALYEELTKAIQRDYVNVEGI